MLLSRRSLLAGTTSTVVLAAAPQISSATGSRKTLRLGTRRHSQQVPGAAFMQRLPKKIPFCKIKRQKPQPRQDWK